MAIIKKETIEIIGNFIFSCVFALVIIGSMYGLSLVAGGSGEEVRKREELEAKRRFTIIVGQDTVKNVKLNRNILSRDEGKLPDGRLIIIPNNAVIIEEKLEGSYEFQVEP